jgi:hypothetical protein
MDPFHVVEAGFKSLAAIAFGCLASIAFVVLKAQKTPVRGKPARKNVPLKDRLWLGTIWATSVIVALIVWHNTISEPEQISATRLVMIILAFILGCLQNQEKLLP